MGRLTPGQVVAWEGLDQDRYMRVILHATPKAGASLSDLAKSICQLLSSPESNAPSDRMAFLLSQPAGERLEIAVPALLVPAAQGATQLLNVLSLPVEYDHAEALVVQDFSASQASLGHYPGPQAGVQGVRQAFKVSEGPLLGVILKPRLMANIDHHLETIRELAKVGLDFLVDDELMVDIEGASFAMRLPKIVNALATGKSQKRRGYVVNVTGRPSTTQDFAAKARAAGAAGLVTNPIVTGFGALEDLAQQGLDLPIIATNIGAALFAKGPLQGAFAGLTEATLAKLTRLAGADAVHLGMDKADWYGHAPGEGAMSVLGSPLRTIKPVFRVIAGGLDIIKMIENWPYDGEDVIFEAGSAVFNHPFGPAAGLRAFHTAYAIAMDSAGGAPAEARDRAKNSLLERGKKDKAIAEALSACGWRPGRA